MKYYDSPTLKFKIGQNMVQEWRNVVRVSEIRGVVGWGRRRSVGLCVSGRRRRRSVGFKRN